MVLLGRLVFFVRRTGTLSHLDVGARSRASRRPILESVTAECHGFLANESLRAQEALVKKETGIQNKLPSRFRKIGEIEYWYRSVVSSDVVGNAELIGQPLTDIAVGLHSSTSQAGNHRMYTMSEPELSN